MSKYLGDSLIPKMVERINQHNKTTVILCTVNADGTPNSAPMTFIHAINDRTIRFALYCGGQTLKNIKSTGVLCFSLITEGNIALTIKGRGSIVKERMDASSDYSMVEITIDAVKSDRSVFTTVEQGIGIVVSEGSGEWTERVFQELESG